MTGAKMSFVDQGEQSVPRKIMDSLMGSTLKTKLFFLFCFLITYDVVHVVDTVYC